MIIIVNYVHEATMKDKRLDSAKQVRAVTYIIIVAIIIVIIMT